MATKTMEAAEIRAQVEDARTRLATLEERRSAAAEREYAARAERAAKLAEDAGSYRPELAAAVDAAAAEREALTEAHKAVEREIETLQSRLKVAEAAEADTRCAELREQALAAWAKLDVELMKLAPKILKLHDDALRARHEYHRAGERVGRNVYLSTPPGVERAMHSARPYLEGEERRAAEKRQEREERRKREEEERRRQQAAERERQEAARKAKWDAMSEAERLEHLRQGALYSSTSLRW